MEVKFKKNLVALRQTKKISQEQLAEKLDVSRQSISKWESGEAYPEMRTLLNICDFFGVDLGVLVHGDITEETDSSLRKKYGQIVRHHAKFTALGVGLILVGVTLMLTLMTILGGGASAAGCAGLILLVAIAVALFIMDGQVFDRFKKSHRELPLNLFTEQETEDGTNHYQKGVAAGIGIILFGVSVFLVLISFLEDIATVGILMCFLAVGVPVLIYNDQQKDKYDIEKYNLENSEDYLAKDHKSGRIAGIIMMSATIVFLLLGFLGSLWHVA